ncbi:MAG: hypothetical protein L0Z70_00470 [Chloroflexi bacterium]|nr:hypothetical protein [Chloroflexota bacterium]
MTERNSLAWLRAGLAALFLLTLAVGAQFLQPAWASGDLFQARRWWVVLALTSAALAALLAAALLAWTRRAACLHDYLAARLRGMQRLRWLNVLLYALWVGLLGFLVVGRFSHLFRADALRWSLFAWFALLGVLPLKAAFPRQSWLELAAASLLLQAVVYRSAGYAGDVSTYPFTLNWSEGSRYYYASLFFAERIYAAPAAPTVLHPSRYLMQALPFLLPSAGIWLHRLWQVALWIVTSGLWGAGLARRLRLTGPLRPWTIAAWAFLYLLIGPVYYHLLVPVILIVWFFLPEKFWRGLVVVLLASAWAGISRVNWFPLPAALAAALYVMETPLQGRSAWRYLLPPAAWGALGGAAAFGAQALYAVLSGNPAGQFTSSFTSDLLWYRLLPSTTYSSGVLLAAAVTAGPLALLAMERLWGRWREWSALRLLLPAAALLVFFAGGLVVSVKIGGGSNLHNLDAFFALLTVVCAYIIFERFLPDSHSPAADSPPACPLRRWLAGGLAALTLLLPVVHAALLVEPPERPDFPAAQDALDRLRRFTTRAAAEGGEVLFIADRQLLTYGFIQGVPLVADYEKVFLMEMAMAGDSAYLARFQADIANQRFALIVTDPLFVQYKGRAEAFGEENDAWVLEVAAPVLCYYEPFRMFRAVHLQLLIPREEPGECP